VADGAVRLNLSSPLVKARLSADSSRNFGLCFGHEVSFLLCASFSRLRFSAKQNIMLADGEDALVARNGWGNRRSPQLLI
jgi:hypothetical protein